MTLLINVNNGMHFVIARFNEDISWAYGLKKTVIQKGKDMPNIGREPASYLLYIINNYAIMEGEYVFCQGNPFDHCPNFLEEVKTTNHFGGNHVSDMNGSPDHPGLPMKEFCEKLGIEDRTFVFKAGCQFKLTADEIRSIPYNKYVEMFNLMIQNELHAWVFERMPITLWKNFKY